MIKFRGLGSKNYIFALLVVPLWCVFVSIDKASAATSPETSEVQTTSTTQSSTQSTTTKDKSKNRKTNQSIAQGLSVAESMMKNKSPWGFALSTSAARGFDQYTDTWYSSSGLDLTYRLNAASAIGLSLNYESILYDKDGSLFNNSDSDPSQYGLGDTAITYSRPGIWKDKYNTLIYSSSLSLPSSKTSQNATMIASWNNSLTLRYSPINRLIISTNVGMNLNAHRYDDGDAFGYNVNSPFGMRYGLSGSYVFTQWLIGSVSYGQYQRLDYDNNWDLIQNASATATITALENLSIFGGYSWADNVLTNDVLFSANRISIFTGVQYAF